nr:hypothetical protein BaRGS_031376 [Batillaria attramentaria]
MFGVPTVNGAAILQEMLGTVPNSSVIAVLQFGDYLNQPCYAAAASQFPRPRDLSDLHEGDFDVLIIHKKMGLIAGEIKSVGIRAKGQGLTDPQIENDVLKMLRKMLKMSKKSTRGKQSSRKGTGKTLTAVIMGVEWMRQNKTVNILSGDRKSRAAAHHIKQQLEETARQAASRVRLHLVHLDEYGAELAANVDKLVKTLTSSATNNEICLIADEVSGYSAAFDTLDHSVMLRRLEITFGVRDLRNAPTLSVFKSSLKTFLFRKAYQ